MTTEQLQTEIEIHNLGPIEGTFTFEVQGPGLYELSGSKGVGKSTILSAMELLAGHKVDLTVHDGELSGHASGFGVVTPVGSKKRSKGDLEVDVLEAKFSFADLVDPGGKSAAARDAQRIKALASLSGTEATPVDYYELVGGSDKYDQLGVKDDTDDPVVLAGRVKSALESEARRHESVQQSEHGHATACMESTRGVDFSKPHDEGELSKALSDATTSLADLQRTKKERTEAHERQASAKQKLINAKANYDGPSVEEAIDHFNTVQDGLDKLNDQKREIEALIEQQKTEARAAELDRDAAKRHYDLMSELESSIDTEIGPVPADDEIERAQKNVAAAREANNEGVTIREALKSKQRASEHGKKADEARRRSESLRSAAAGVFGVLASKIKSEPIKIESVEQEPRLVVMHPTRKKTLFDSANGLSDGERVRYAIEALLPLIDEPGLFALPQRLYQDLPPSDRAWLDGFAREKGIVVIGAQVTDDELQVKRYQ